MPLGSTTRRPTRRWLEIASLQAVQRTSCFCQTGNWRHATYGLPSLGRSNQVSSSRGVAVPAVRRR